MLCHLMEEARNNFSTRVSMTQTPFAKSAELYTQAIYNICAENIVDVRYRQKMASEYITYIPTSIKEIHLKKNETTTQHGHVSAQKTQIKEDNVTSCVFERILFCFFRYFAIKYGKNCKHNKQHTHRYASSLERAKKRKKKTETNTDGNIVRVS